MTDRDLRRAIVPAISSSVMGPLGIRHVPRLWLKMLLHAAGQLPDGYRHGEGGFDGLVCERLGLDAAELETFVAERRPDYQQFERWIAERARNLTPHTVAALNERIRTGNMPAELAAGRRARFGIPDDAFANGIALNDLDDWSALHAEIIEDASTSS